MPRYDLDGVPVVVTGAATGIGRGIAEAFAAQGANLAVVDRDAARVQQAAEALGAEAFAADLNDDAAAAQLADRLAGRFGHVAVLVNNAGTEYPTPIDDQAPDAMARWQWLIDNNVLSMVRVTRALLPLMRPGASIVNQSSIWGHTAVGGFSAYVASKHAVLGITRSLARELAPRGIRVNAVCPGWVRTEASLRSLAAMAREQGRPEDAVLQDILAAQAVPRLLEPADIAGIYLFLASRDAAALTGQSLVASHGEVMH
jgi:NAD(P)-dependent dehydrogenase (short-subunit alcohol dehydrogenase family)